MRFAQAQEAEPQYITVYRGHLRKGPVRRMLANQSVQLSLRGEHFSEQPLCFVSARRVGALLLDQPRQHRGCGMAGQVVLVERLEREHPGRWLPRRTVVPGGNAL